MRSYFEIRLTWPYVEDLTVFIEHLNPAVGAIGYVDTTFAVYGNAVWHLQLAGLSAFGPPRQQEFTVLVELDDTRVDVTVRDQD